MGGKVKDIFNKKKIGPCKLLGFFTLPKYQQPKMNNVSKKKENKKSEEKLISPNVVKTSNTGKSFLSSFSHCSQGQ
jgi:hypothetical protein